MQSERREAAPSSMFYAYNSALGPPYHVIVDTNFINFSIQVCVALFLLPVISATENYSRRTRSS